MSLGEGFILNHRGEEVEPRAPRIAGLQIDKSETHFHKINYKKDLKISLQKSITFGEPGLMTKAEYFEDEAKTIPVLTIDREYDIDPVIGKLLKKRTKRTYFCEDGLAHPEVKDGGWYVYTGEESRDATHRRRVNITNRIENDMLDLLKSAAGNDPLLEAVNIAAGAQFLSALTPVLNIFHQSGDSSGVITFVSDAGNHALYPFLAADVAPNLKAYQFIVAGVTY